MFNNPQVLWANIILGILLFALGSYFIFKMQSKGKKTLGIFCLVIGFLAVLTNATQLFFPLL